MIDPEASLEIAAPFHRAHRFLSPTDLSVTDTPLRRVLVVGSCMMDTLRSYHGNHPSCPIDFVVTNNVNELTENPPRAAAEYNFQIVQLALRSLMHDEQLWKHAQKDEARYALEFEQISATLALRLEMAMKWNIKDNLLTFVVSFLVPIQSPTGRLLPRYSLSNPKFFIEQLNIRLSELASSYSNCHILDFDEIASALGKARIQDDGLFHVAHNSVWQEQAEIENRIEPIAPTDLHYDVQIKEFTQAVWSSAIAMYRTIHQADAVKMVVVDLDDTLWNGVSGEEVEFDPAMIEGWPLGLIEALAYLKKRGIILGILSKNDEARVNAIWDRIMHGRLNLSDFAVRKINWRPKPESMDEALAEVNLLPRSVIFIDDNPVERAAMRSAFPDMRVLGRHPYYLRRILLWSSETQVAAVTSESGRRTEMVQAQINRETQRKALSRDDFLRSLHVTMRPIDIDTIDHPRFDRTFELLNKTNQFNTTGRRWSIKDCMSAFQDRLQFQAFEVDDRFTGYGLVVLVLVRPDSIEQMVMSCRVLGLGVEDAALAHVLSRLRHNGECAEISAQFSETDTNLACRNLFPRAGFSMQNGHLVKSLHDPLNIPAHISISLA